MDIEQAKFILSSFRPDGQDAQDPDFAEALALASEDRELGAWLAQERAEDALFSKALTTLPIPEELREDIIMSLNQDTIIDDDPELDELFTDAFSDILPPADLRDQVLAAMELEQKVIRPRFQWKKLLPAAAAIVILGLSATFLLAPTDKPNLEEVSAYTIQQETGALLLNDGVTLIGNNPEESMQWLRKQDLPTVDLPSGLKDMRCAGATAITLKNGVKASLMRFYDEDNKEINMVVIDSQLVADAEQMPKEQKTSQEQAYYCNSCDFMIARIRSGKAVVILLSQLDKKSTVELF